MPTPGIALPPRPVAAHSTAFHDAPAVQTSTYTEELGRPFTEGCMDIHFNLLLLEKDVATYMCVCMYLGA